MSKRKVNPFSRFAPDMPVLAPAGKSTKVEQVVRKNLTVPAGHKGLIAFTNIGQGANHGVIYTWVPGDATSAPEKQLVSFSMFPASWGDCVEMRASRSSLIVRNNTTPLNRAPYGYAFVGPNRPQCSDYPNTQPNGGVLENIFNQIYGRRETQAYNYDAPRELINGMSDFIDYHSYDSPSNYPIFELEKRLFNKHGELVQQNLGMTVVYFIIPTAAHDQSLDLEFYNCVRARYDISNPLSRYAEKQPEANGKEREHVIAAASEISEGTQPSSTPPASAGGQHPR